MLRPSANFDELGKRVAARFKPTESMMNRQAIFMEEQARDRIETQGASGGTPWVKRVLGKSTEPILGGINHSVDKSFKSFAEGAERSVLASNHPGARLFQYGTVGKGGKMPTVVPKRAKALFIPLTQKAKDAYASAPHPVRTPYGATRFEKTPGWLLSLVRGKISGGKIEPPDADYIFLSKADYEPRPILPTSAIERAAQIAHFVGMNRERP